MAEDRAIEIRVVVLGRAVLRVPCPEGTSLEALIDAAGVDRAGRDIHVNGHARPLDQPVEDGDLVTVIPRVRGG
jgi:sulfur carrier protein ThiS